MQPHLSNLISRWRANFVTGLIIVLPGVISIGLLCWLVGTVSNFTDGLLFFLPRSWTHDSGIAGPGTGAVHWYWSLFALIVTLVLIGLVGQAARNYLGRRALRWIDSGIMQVPFLNKIYGTVKQVNEAFSNNKSSFKQVVLVHFPHPGAWSVGFVTGEQKAFSVPGQELVSVFVPTTPNPTAGFIIMVPASEVVKLDVTVAEGIKFIISLGSITPEQAAEQTAALKTKSRG